MPLYFQSCVWWVFISARILSNFGLTLADQTTSIPLNGTVQEFLMPANRHASYAVVKPRRLQALLEKLSRYSSQQRDLTSRELAERRRKEAEAVGRLYPGENR